MKKRIVDEETVLVPYYPNYETALEWYQNLRLCKQVDNTDEVYSLNKLKRMYQYLSAHGDCFYIEYQGRLIGDVTLKNDGEISIVICSEYQNRHIGRRCLKSIVELAKEKGLAQVKAQIYAFNKQSETVFKSLGFEKERQDDWYVLSIR